MSFAFRDMETQPRGAALTATALAVLVIGACGGQGGNVASRTPSPSSSPAQQASATGSPTPVPSPVRVTGAYGVLYGSQSASTYTITIIGVDGKIVAAAEASTPPLVTCGGQLGAPVAPPISTSDSRVYFMDAQGVVRFLAPDGTTGRATSVPAPTASRRAMFTVSPDDRRIAVVVNDYTASGASTKLYVEDLSGAGNHIDTFSQSGSRTLWPVGWHGTNNLVVAVVASCTSGGGPFCCGPLELHVVDPATATRRFTLGNVTSCLIAGSPSPAGVACESQSQSQATVLNWTAGTVRTLALNRPSFVYVSPSGSLISMVDDSGTSFTLGAATIPGMFACTWLDDTHVLSGGDAQHQPRVADVVNGRIAPVAAQGDCAGRLPGGL